ncbi:hypothetical protein [Bosea sp. BH3]|uniref:hypothetical protein n=1 Tax=Bosea sp. BH3 TaxID=2871701 RepID=UPI0021CAF8BF|nr:hypothetical protein [Bosea sp. BH3]MCU4179382.1 hypothetical protein [Bosea sp. BH3]
MGEPRGTVYLRAGGAERFRKDTAKRFARRVNKTLLKIDAALAAYPSLTREERTQRTQALLAIVALCDSWLSDKQTKIDHGESFRAAAVQDLHGAAVAELRGLQNWTKAKTAIRKLIPSGSLKNHGTAPLRIMQKENWLEVVDKHHRRGQELSTHFEAWEKSAETCSFWEYLEKQAPDVKNDLANVSVRYVDDLIFRALFEVSFDRGMIWSRMSPTLQNMILSKMGRSNIFHHAELRPLDTTTWPSNALRGMSTGWAAFVLSPQEVVYAGMHVGGVFHHSSFLSGAPVLASGMIRVENGHIRGIHEKNGHYRSQEVHLRTFLKHLLHQLPGTNWHDVEYITFGGTSMSVGSLLGLQRRPSPPPRPPRPAQQHVAQGGNVRNLIQRFNNS